MCLVMNSFVDLFNLKKNEMTYCELDNDEWLQDLMFLTDIMENFQTLNCRGKIK